MSWLAFIFALQLGLIDGGYLSDERAIFVPMVPQTRLEAAVEAWGVLRVGGAIDTPMNWPRGDLTFDPIRADYWFGVSATWRGLSAGWDHVCRHAMFTGFSTFIPQTGYGDRIYVRYERRVGL